MRCPSVASSPRPSDTERPVLGDAPMTLPPRSRVVASRRCPRGGSDLAGRLRLVFARGKTRLRCDEAHLWLPSTRDQILLPRAAEHSPAFEEQIGCWVIQGVWPMGLAARPPGWLDGRGPVSSRERCGGSVIPGFARWWCTVGGRGLSAASPVLAPAAQA